MNIDHNNFCVVPFVQLNTRGKGDARVCCSIEGIDFGIPKNLTIDEINQDTYSSDTDVYNLSKDKIEDLWNGKFMQDFRMKMLNGERIPNCDFCFRMENSGFGSKRTGKNKKFYNIVESLLQGCYNRNGFVDTMPQWWEIRLSTKCNLSCIMCSPNLSSMMYKEYSKWNKEMTAQMQGSLDIACRSGEEYLSQSEFFKDQILSNLAHVLFMEFRGGEVFADRHSIDFMWEIAQTEYAKSIQLDISTNGTLISEEIIDLLNHFGGGLLRFSIDAGFERDELIRYHTNWNDVVKSIKMSNNLNDNWEMVTQTCLQLLNCVGLVPLLEYIDGVCQNSNNERFHLGFTSVRGKEWLRHELVPLEYRKEEIEKIDLFMKNSWLCNKSVHKNRERKSLEGLKQALSADTCNDERLIAKAKEYFLKLNKLRQVDYWQVFSHLEFMNE